MINYSGLWNVMKDRGITQYNLITVHKFSPDVFTRVRNNKNLSTSTLEKLCKVLNCNVCDIIEFTEEKNDKVQS